MQDSATPRLFNEDTHVQVCSNATCNAAKKPHVLEECGYLHHGCCIRRGALPSWSCVGQMTLSTAPLSAPGLQLLHQLRMLPDLAAIMPKDSDHYVEICLGLLLLLLLLQLLQLQEPRPRPPPAPAPAPAPPPTGTTHTTADDDAGVSFKSVLNCRDAGRLNACAAYGATPFLCGEASVSTKTV